MGHSLHRNRPGGNILIYHGIDQEGSTRFNSRFISQEAFAQQVKYFAENFHCVSLDRYFSGERDSARLTVSLTFDDGYLNNLELALPVLEKYEVPAAFFVTTVRAIGQDHLWPDWVDLGGALATSPLRFSEREYRRNRHGQLASGKTTLNQELINHPEFDMSELDQALPSNSIRLDPNLGRYWRLVDETDLQRLAASPFATIGSHGLSHRSLPTMSRAEAKHEMAESKHWLESTIGQEVDAIAFPFGHYTSQNLDDAEELGYRSQLAVEFVHSRDHMDDRVQERFGINPYINWDLQLTAILEGRY